MKKTALMLTFSMISMLLPVDLPLYYLSSQAFADDSSAMPLDSTNRHVAPGVPVETFEAGTTGSAVNHMNMVMSIQGPAPFSTTPTPTAVVSEGASTASATTVDPSTELALATPAEVAAAIPSAPMAFATPQQISAAIEAAKVAMEPHIILFVNDEWTGFSGGLKRPFVKSKIREDLGMLIGMVITTGGTIGFSTSPVATGRNLIVTMNYPGGIIFTITISVSPTAGNSPSEGDISKAFTSNITTVFTQAMISTFQTIVKLLIGAFSDPPMPPMPVVAGAASSAVAVSEAPATSSASPSLAVSSARLATSTVAVASTATSAALAFVPPPPPIEGAETPAPPLDLPDFPDFPDLGDSAPLGISDIYMPLFPDTAPGESHPGPTDFPFDLPMPIGPPPGADPPLVPILIGNEPLQLALIDPPVMPIPDAPEDPVIDMPDMPV